MPFDDWQFWVVTLAGLWGAWVLTRKMLPRKKRRVQKTQLTIGGEQRGQKSGQKRG